MIKQILKTYKDKQIIVAHNLKTLETVNEVEKEIKELLTQFHMKEQMISEETLKKNKDFELKYKYFFAGTNNDNLFHLIFAREGTPAGVFYNESAMAWLKSLIIRQIKKEMNIPAQFTEYISENVCKYFKTNDEKKKICFPEFSDPTTENGLAVSSSKIKEKLTSIRVVLNFLGDVESSQSFKPELKFESEGEYELKEDKRIKGKIKLPLNSKTCAIIKAFFYTIEDEVYIHLEGFKNSFKYEPPKEKKEAYLQDLTPLPSCDHTTFGPFLIKASLSELAMNDKRLQLKDQKKQMRTLMGRTGNSDTERLGEQRGNFYEIDFGYKIIQKT